MSRFGDGVDNCLYKIVISSTRQRAISRQGVWGVFYMLRQRGGKGIILNFKNFNYMHDRFGLF